MTLNKRVYDEAQQKSHCHKDAQTMGVDLSSFRRNESVPGRSRAAQLAWMILGHPLVRSSWLPGSGWRTGVLRVFGADIEAGVVIKPGVRVKYPWKLRVGHNSWIGEDCWIDNLEDVTIGANVCLSQSCYLCTGNHDWKDRSFRMFTMPITLEDGSWVASRCTLGPGVTVGRDAIAAIGSVVWKSIPAGEIHGGNPSARCAYRSFHEGEMLAESAADGSCTGLVSHASK